MGNHLVRAVSFLTDSVVIEYTTPEKDIASNGLVMQHALSIPGTEEYAARLDDLVDAVQALLADALTDHGRYPSAVDVALEEEDEGPGPYDNPLERPEMVLPPQE